jgi:hypothetical protein
VSSHFYTDAERAAFYKSCALSGEVPSGETIAMMDRRQDDGAQLNHTLSWQALRQRLIISIQSRDEEEIAGQLLGFMAEHWGLQVPRQSEFAEMEQRMRVLEAKNRQMRAFIKTFNHSPRCLVEVDEETTLSGEGIPEEQLIERAITELAELVGK